MQNLEKKLIELGVIDNFIKSIQIDEWFENVRISFNVNEDANIVVCEFKNCFEISFKHDKSYSKGRRSDGELDYKYFVQDIEVIESEGFLKFNISGWPLDGKITCKSINVNTQNNGSE